jgi:hypothetical protein
MDTMNTKQRFNYAEGAEPMRVKNQSFYQKMICDAHTECQERLFGIRSAEPVALISKNKVVIISKKNDKTAGESRISIRGRRFDPYFACDKTRSVRLRHERKAV